MDDFPGPGEMVDGDGGQGFNPFGGDGLGVDLLSGGTADPGSPPASPGAGNGAASGGAVSPVGPVTALAGQNFSNPAQYTVEGAAGVRDVNEVY